MVTVFNIYFFHFCPKSFLEKIELITARKKNRDYSVLNETLYRVFRDEREIFCVACVLKVKINMYIHAHVLAVT